MAFLIEITWLNSCIKYHYYILWQSLSSGKAGYMLMLRHVKTIGWLYILHLFVLLYWDPFSFLKVQYYGVGKCRVNWLALCLPPEWLANDRETFCWWHSICTDFLVKAKIWPFRSTWQEIAKIIFWCKTIWSRISIFYFNVKDSELVKSVFSSNFASKTKK